jgi:hypothetical protein
LLLAQRYWNRLEQEIGSADLSATGVGASYVARTDYLLEQIIRFWESEQSDVYAMIAFAKRWPNTIKMYPDSLITSLFFDAQLWSPRVTETVRSTRNRFPRVLEMSLVWRRIDDQPWTLVFNDL